MGLFSILPGKEGSTKPEPVQLKKVIYRAYSQEHHHWILPDFEDTDIEQLIRKQVCSTAYVVRTELWQGNEKLSETNYYEHNGYSYVRGDAD